MLSGNDSYTALEYRFFMTSILRFMLAHFCSEKVSKHYDMSSSRPGEMHAVAYGLKSTQPIKYRVIIVNEYTRSFTRSEQQPQLGYKASDKMNTAWVLRYYVSRFLRKTVYTGYELASFQFCSAFSHFKCEYFACSYHFTTS